MDRKEGARDEAYTSQLDGEKVKLRRQDKMFYTQIATENPLVNFGSWIFSDISAWKQLTFFQNSKQYWKLNL